jgi:hypothetical protein
MVPTAAMLVEQREKGSFDFVGVRCPSGSWTDETLFHRSRNHEKPGSVKRFGYSGKLVDDILAPCTTFDSVDEHAELSVCPPQPIHDLLVGFGIIGGQRA